MTEIIAVFEYLQPIIKLAATGVGVLAYGVYYFATANIDWDETDEAQ